MGDTLYVAAGGGGDAIAAWALHASRSDERPVIATFAWDRLIIDPLPGPRSRADFEGLVPVDELNAAFTPSTRPLPPSGSTLPRLAGAIDATLVLLDPSLGVVGLRHQLRSLTHTTGARRVVVIDVGGDIIARGDEPELLSPLADSMVLAATADVDLPITVQVVGAGLDGELSAEVVVKYVDALGGRPAAELDRASAGRTLSVLEWHPSESTALVVAAALGRRGTAEIRDRGSRVKLDEQSATSYEVGGDHAVEHSLTASAMKSTRSLVEAEDLVRAVCGRSELDHERNKAVGLSTKAVDDRDTQLATAVAYLGNAHGRGIDILTFRRIAEVAGAGGEEDFSSLRRALIAALPAQYAPPVMTTSPVGS